MTSALLFGKFLPFHRGHLAMIEYAKSKYDHVTVIIFSRGGETWPGELRASWIKESDSSVKVVHCPMDYCDPWDSESWQVWTKVLNGIGAGVTHLVTSETYGIETARLCGWTHDMYDIERKIHKISGTALRTDPIQNWEFVPNVVRHSLVKKVAIVGAESTGKSTIAQNIANDYNSEWVPEFGREYCRWKKIESLGVRDFEEIVREQSSREDEASEKSNGLIFCDTEAIVTRGWSRFLLGFEPPSLRGLINPYELFALTSLETNWVQDGTRVFGNSQDRKKFHEFVHSELVSSAFNYVQMPSRLSDAVLTLSNVIDTRILSACFLKKKY